MNIGRALLVIKVTSLFVVTISLADETDKLLAKWQKKKRLIVITMSAEFSGNNYFCCWFYNKHCIRALNFPDYYCAKNK